MSVYTSSRLPLGTLATHRIVSFAAEGIARFQAWHQRRRTVRMLRVLSARQLDDIGLAPGDIDEFERTGRF